MEKRINKELNDLTNDGYEVIISKKNNTTILISDTFKIELSSNYPFKEPTLWVALHDNKFATISDIENWISQNKIIDTLQIEDRERLHFIRNEIINSTHFNYSPSIRLIFYIKHLDFLSKIFYNYN